MKTLYILSIVYGLTMLLACSQSGRRHPNSYSEPTSTQLGNKTAKNWEGKTVVKMEKKDGVYEVPIEINGVNMFFIFDTGAGMISISATEALFLYKQGSLRIEDFVEISSFMDANGNISEGTIINLKTVKIGNRTLKNIRAVVVHNLNAPLLLGQTALEEFGKISIDNVNAQIIFE